MGGEALRPLERSGTRLQEFPRGHAEACAVEIAAGISRRYGAFAARLRAGVDAGAFVTRFLPGNHDYMVQLSPRLRQIAVDLLALDHDPAKPFPLCHVDRKASVYATHGHSFDPLNWHREADGYWAVGDAVVLRIVNRFAEIACERLGLAPETRLGRMLQDVENVEPVTDVPLYIRWIADVTLSGDAQRAIVAAAWKQVVDDFLDLKEFSDQDGFAGAPYAGFRRTLQASAFQTIAQLADALSPFVSGRRDAYAENARRLGAQHGCRFVLFGHTHQPGLLPTGPLGEAQGHYVNSGCWRRIVSRTRPPAPISFAPRQVASDFVVGHGVGDAGCRLRIDWRIP